MMTKEYRRIDKQEAAHHSDKFCFLNLDLFVCTALLLLPFLCETHTCIAKLCHQSVLISVSVTRKLKNCCGLPPLEPRKWPK